MGGERNQGDASSAAMEDDEQEGGTIGSKRGRADASEHDSTHDEGHDPDAEEDGLGLMTALTWEARAAQLQAERERARAARAKS